VKYFKLVVIALFLLPIGYYSDGSCQTPASQDDYFQSLFDSAKAGKAGWPSAGLDSFVIAVTDSIAGDAAEYTLQFVLSKKAFLALSRGGFSFFFPGGFDLSLVQSAEVLDNHAIRDYCVDHMKVSDRLLTLNLKRCHKKGRLECHPPDGAQVNVAVKLTHVGNPTEAGSYELGGLAFNKHGSIIAGPGFSQEFAIVPGPPVLPAIPVSEQRSKGKSEEQRSDTEIPEKEGQQGKKTFEDYLALARSFYAKKNYEAAQDMLNLIFDIDPWYAEALRLRDKIRSDVTSEISLNFEKARAAEREGQYVKALEAYDRILYLDPLNEMARTAKQRIAKDLDVTQQLNASILLFKAGRYVEARQRFSAVLAIDPSQPVALEYVKRIDQALAKPPTLEDLQKDKVIWQLYLDGLRYMRNEEYEKAIEVWEKVLQAYPNNSNTLENIEQARLRLQSEKGR
jgi:hypothetical protein